MRAGSKAGHEWEGPSSVTPLPSLMALYLFHILCVFPCQQVSHFLVMYFKHSCLPVLGFIGIYSSVTGMIAMQKLFLLIDSPADLWTTRNQEQGLRGKEVWDFRGGAHGNFSLFYTLLEKMTVIITLVTLCFKTRHLPFYVVQVVGELWRLLSPFLRFRIRGEHHHAPNRFVTFLNTH